MFGPFAHIPRKEARAALISLSVGISLLIIKYTAYFLTQSAAIFSDATESIANALASVVARYCLAVAHRPAVAAAVFIVLKTLDALWHGYYASQETAGTGIVLVAAATLANAIVGIYLVR